MTALLPIFFALSSIMQDAPSGIYIVIESSRKVPCENELRMVVRRQKVCVSRAPILNLDEVSYTTAIRYDPARQTHYIDIGLTDAGVKAVTQTAISLPDSQFALVLRGEVICLFMGSTDYAVTTIRIGEDAPLKDLMEIEEALKGMKE